MRLAGAVLLALLSAALPPPAGAQGFGSLPEATSLVKVAVDPVEVPAGGTANARIALTIEPTWHVNANPPALDYMIPTEVSVMPGAGITAGRAVYPAPHKVKLSFEETELLLYDGSAMVQIPISAGAAIPPGEHELKGRVGFQACNDQVCLAPTSVNFTLKVRVTAAAPGAGGSGGGPAPDSAATELSPAVGTGLATAPPEGGAPAGSPVNVRDRLQAALARGGLVWLLALFAGGLLLNLTPCVFPMLGVTVSIFGARRKEPLPRVLGAATLYVLGICVMYSSLGVVAALTGGLFGSALQSPWVGIGLGVLLVGLSLSMFGLYEMQPPAWMLQRLGGADATSAVGLFLSGLAVGVIAAPCVGPFVVAVLALIAQRGDALFGFQTMFALSIGLGFPYLFLATFSNLLQRLPRSGGWMVWVKKVFGVILASVGLVYVLIGLKPDWAPMVLPAALILGGLYLGFLDQSAGGKRGFRMLRWASGALAIAAGVWVLATAPKQGITFRDLDAAELEAGLARGKVAMLDFTADWCAPCHELELITFTDPRVRSLASEFLLYQVDLTRYNSPESERLRRQYSIPGVPAVVFLGPDGKEVWQARVEGFIGPEPMLERMRFAAARARPPAP